MSDNLRITAPLSSNGKAENPNLKKEVLTPERSGSRKNYPPLNGGPDGENAFRQFSSISESGFGRFIENFMSTPSLSETVNKLINLSSESREAIQDEKGSESIMLSWLFERTAANTSDLQKALCCQHEDLTGFRGPLFGFLRELSAELKDNEFDFRFCAFLKAFDGFLMLPVTMSLVKKNLETIRTELPPAYANELSILEGLLKDDNSSDRFRWNLTVMNEQILPFLGRYISDTNDYGKARDNSALLMHNIALLNSGSRDDLLSKFENVLEYCKYRVNLDDNSLGTLRKLFADEIMASSREENGTFVDALISLLNRKNFSAPGPGKTHLQDACRSLLLDQSVYMPFQRIFLPVQLDGRFGFSELWIEKRDERESDAQNAEYPGTEHILISLDVYGLGAFEASVQLFDRNINLEVSLPPELKTKGRIIGAGIRNIFEHNGFKVSSVEISGEPLDISKRVAEKIRERKYMLNVTV